MLKYNDTPDLAFARLEGIAEEIASGIRVVDVEETFDQLANANCITECLRGLIENDVKSGLKTFWEIYSVEENLLKVKDLACSQHKSVSVDQPVKDLNKAIKGDFLKKYKSTIQEKLDQIKTLNKTLENSLSLKTNLYNEQIDNVNKIVFK